MSEHVTERTAQSHGPEEPAEKRREAGEFHYHYSARKDSPLSGSGRELLAVTGKVFLTGAVVMGGLFAGGFLLIAVLVLGGFAVFLGGGTVFCLATAVHLIAAGLGALSASVFPGLGVCGLGLVIAAVSLLFLFAAIFWVKRVMPGAAGLYRRLRTMLPRVEEDGK